MTHTKIQQESNDSLHLLRFGRLKTEKMTYNNSQYYRWFLVFKSVLIFPNLSRCSESFDFCCMFVYCLYYLDIKLTFNKRGAPKAPPTHHHINVISKKYDNYKNITKIEYPSPYQCYIQKI